MIYTTCAKMCSFVMHRGLIIANIQFFFMMTFFFVDMPIFNGMLIFGYSTVYTSLPVVALISDEDLTYKEVRDHPLLYRELQRGRYLNFKAFCIILMKSMFQGAVIILMTVTIFQSNILDIVTICFTSLILTELLNTISMVSSVSCKLISSLLASMLIYYLSIVYFKEYISIENIDSPFAIKICIVVAASWGVIFIGEKIEECIWPSFKSLVLAGKKPVLPEKAFDSSQAADDENLRGMNELAEDSQKKSLLEKEHLL